MYIEAIKIKRTKESEWERGYYIGASENSKKSVFLDVNYKPIERDKLGVLQIWEYHSDLENKIQININDENKDIRITTN